MAEMELAIQAATTPVVKMWMNWMLAIFAISIVFAWKHVAARIVLASLILSLPLALLVFNTTKSAHLIGLVHIVVWGPLAYYLVKKVVLQTSFKVLSVYGIWITLLLATIAVSLVFDVRDVTMVFLGMK